MWRHAMTRMSLGYPMLFPFALAVNQSARVQAKGGTEGRKKARSTAPSSKPHKTDIL
jgi:hypothetical protein